jgi:hypothetical protein
MTEKKQIIFDNEDILNFFESNKDINPQLFLLKSIDSFKNEHTNNDIPQSNSNGYLNEINSHFKEYQKYEEDIENLLNSLKNIKTKIKKNENEYLWKYIKEKNNDFVCDNCKIFISKSIKGLSIHKRKCNISVEENK